MTLLESQHMHFQVRRIYRKINHRNYLDVLYQNSTYEPAWFNQNNFYQVLGVVQDTETEVR